MKLERSLLIIPLSLVWTHLSYAQIISRPSPPESENSQWPRVNAETWPERLRQSYQAAMMMEGDDDRQEALFVLNSRALREAGHVEQSVALIQSLKGSRKWIESASLAAELWAKDAESKLAQKLYELAIKGIPSQVPAQRQYLLAELAKASAASPRQDHQMWLDQIYDEDIHQTAVGACYVRTLKRQSKVGMDDLEVWIRQAKELKSNISLLYQAEGLLGVAEAMHNVSEPSHMSRADFVEVCRTALEMAHKSNVPDMEVVVRTAQMLQKHDVSDEAEAVFQRATKKVLAAPANLDKRPVLLLQLSDIAKQAGDKEMAAKLQATALGGYEKVEISMRGTVALSLASLLVNQGYKDSASDLCVKAVKLTAENSNPNVRLEFLSRLYLCLHESGLELPGNLAESLKELQERR